MAIYRVEIELAEAMLGSAPLVRDIYADYIAAKAVAQPEVAKLNGFVEQQELDGIADEKKGVTGFLRLEDGTPYLSNHVIKGFMSNAATAFKQNVPTSRTAKLTAYKSKINLLTVVSPRRIPLALAGPLEILSRPLRAETMQGPRVALASSEMAPAGTTLVCEVGVMSDTTIPDAMIEEWFAYGALHGLGQWRGSGMYGQFVATVERVSRPQYTPRAQWSLLGIKVL